MENPMVLMVQGADITFFIGYDALIYQYQSPGNKIADIKNKNRRDHKNHSFINTTFNLLKICIKMSLR